MKRSRVLLLLMLVFSLSACKSWWSKDDDDNSLYKGLSSQALYTQAKSALSKGEYQTAIKQFEALDSMYPFSNYAENAQLYLIYAYYQKEDYASCAATAQRFMHLYPRTKRVDYAYYMKALANFQQTRGFFAKVLPLDEAWRDPGTQSEAYSDFAIFIERFPSSPYKSDALQRMVYLRNMFAQRELHNARYFYERKRYVAAIERANFLVKNYPQAPSVKPALSLIYKANLALGLEKAALDTLAIYKATYHSYPKK